jgi:hypothetical protein
MSLFNSAIFFKNLLSWDYFVAALTTLWISIASLLLGAPRGAGVGYCPRLGYRGFG